VPGAWTECTGDLILPDENPTERSIRMALENQGLADVDYTAIAKIGVNASAGAYCVICSTVALEPYAPVNYAIFFVNVDHATGKVTIESDSTRYIDMYKTEE
jgi:hypothetical protein